MPDQGLTRWRGWACALVVLGAAALWHAVRGVRAAEPSFGRLSSVPNPRAVGAAEALVAAVKQDVLARHGISAPRIVPPVVRVDDFGARGDGVTDDGPAIQRALAALPAGGTVVFSSGKTYLKSDLLVVNTPGVRLWGYGAVLYSVVTDAQLQVEGGAHVALHLDAPRTALYGLTLTSNMRGRVRGHPNLTGVWLSSRDQELIDNRLEYANIFVRKAKGFTVARNVVYRSTADGIHITSGSDSGMVLGNVVRETGDDMIAVVSYGLGEPNVGDVLIEDNDCSAQYWGRGISVVGGHDIQIRNNRVSRTPFGAGILIHSETSYQTSNVRNVLVEANQIRDVQTQVPNYNPAGKWKKTGHGAIDVYGQGTQEVSQVIISNNSIQYADRDAIFVRGNSCDVEVLGNRAEGIGRDAVRIEVSARPGCRIDCRNNTVTGAARLDARCGGTKEAP
ncbi:MAG TPA: right-handed parallel beta-helix repeat-containing protein [Polyangiaceae bacterium]|nr:right-handed parallel beta-helix repeat-containing protein [Polyangiaceae bacterium]